MLDLDHRLDLSATDPVYGHVQMKLIRQDSQFQIAFLDDTVLGDVNVQLEKALTSIAENQYPVEYEVFASVRAIRETISKATKEKDAVVRMQINDYGSRAAAQAVGKEFSQQKIYLQRPIYVRDGAFYDNPHVLKISGFQSSATDVVVPVGEKVSEKATAETLKRVVMNVYSSLTRGQELRGLEGDARLKTSLLL